MRIREFVVVAALFAVVATPGCARRVEGTAVAADNRGAGTSVDPRSPAGTWIGSYTCAQGETGLVLTVAPTSSAEFAFHPLPNNPGPASGRFTMHWSFESDRLAFRQKYWNERPGSYIMVDLIADHHDATVMTGQVVGTGCTTFRLSRDLT